MKLSKLRHATATRHLAGATIPRQNTTSFGMRAALKKGGSRYAGESGEVEGNAARPRLDRPGRKAGGRVCRADGGWTGEGDSQRPMKEKSAALRDEAERKMQSGNAKGVGTGALTGLGIAGMLGARSKIGKLVGAGLTAAGIGKDTGFSDVTESGKLRKASEAADREAEGRKAGGKVRR